jgi:hypothetical protein
MIIGVDATHRWIQQAVVSEKNTQLSQWAGPIEELPNRIQPLLSADEPLRGGLVILGPGSYTGIRLSLTTMKMLTLVHDVPLMGWPLFDAYLALNFSLIQGVVLMTSPSRKGVFNAQLFQTNANGFNAISSLLQIQEDRMKDWLSRFRAPIYWLHFGSSDILIDAPLIHCQTVRLDLVSLIHYTSDRLVKKTPESALFPIYSYPPVMS